MHTAFVNTRRAFASVDKISDMKFLLQLAKVCSDGNRSDLEERLSANGQKPLHGHSSQMKTFFDEKLQLALKTVPASLHEPFFLRLLTILNSEFQLLELVHRCSEQQASSITCLAEATDYVAMSNKLHIEALLTVSLSGRPNSQKPLAQRAPKELPNVLKGLLEADADTSDSDSEQVQDVHDEVGLARRSSIFNFDLQQHGVAGIGARTLSSLQRTLLSRALSEEELTKLGMSHERGLLLFGPPGCGKTLIARALGKVLHATTVQVVSAAEINHKWFGESDKRMKALFNPAVESKVRGHVTDLHLIVMDEIDALAAERSTSDARNHESALNVLLSCLDGFHSNDHSLVIGLTNRKDKLDAALLRPGRLGVHVEVPPPDTDGRLRILSLHAQSLILNDLLAPNVSLNGLADRTDGFTGAQLRQIVNNAISSAIMRKGQVQRHLVDREAFDFAIAEAS